LEKRLGIPLLLRSTHGLAPPGLCLEEGEKRRR
jgi:hypothetical protein